MRKDRRSGLWAWAGLGGLGLVLLLASAVISRARPRPIVTQAQIEQRGLRDGQARGIGHVQQVNAISTTLGRMRQHVGCPLPELVFRALLVAARAEASTAVTRPRACGSSSYGASSRRRSSPSRSASSTPPPGITSAARGDRSRGDDGRWTTDDGRM